MRTVLIVALIAGLILAILAGGCLSSPEPSYQVDDSGHLRLSVPLPPVTEEVIARASDVSVSRIRLHQVGTDVYALLATPERPVAAIVLAPGAGVRKEGHRNRAEAYAREGIACLVLDIRGNGGETAGHPLDFEDDFRRFEEGGWPQTYAITADLIAMREYLTTRFDIPVFAVGESNGGRYAAIATVADPGFSGYIGVSTSGFDLAGRMYSGDARRFLLSIDPDAIVSDLSPRPVLVMHAPDDPIIPYSDGFRLYERAGPPKELFNLTTGHGLNGEADAEIFRYVLHFMSRQ